MPAEPHSKAAPEHLDGRLRPVPSVPIFTATTPVTEIIPALIRAGGCIIRNIIIPEVLAQVEEDTRKYIFSDTEWSGSFFPKETRRVCGLAGKSRTFITHIVSNTLFQSISDHFLTSRITCWIGDKREEHISRPQLNNTVVFSINPGASAQPLHRDDMIHHNKPVSRNPEEYKIGQDTGIGFFIAAKKSTKANGATRFIPGSHLWDLDTPPAEELAVYAEMVPGDAFVFFSSCYHGGSANTTLDEERLLYSFFMTKGYLRQEENQYLAARWEDVGSKYDDATLERLGYGVSAPFLGWVDLRHPLEALRGGTELRDLY